MFGTYIGDDKMLIKMSYCGFLMISSKDLSLMPSLVTTGAIEPLLTKFFIQEVKPGNTIVDIGANVGYFTVLAGYLVGTHGKVIGYEANPTVYEILQDNIAMNWTTTQTKLYNKAVYSEEKTLSFRSSNKFHGDSSTHVRPENENRVEDYTIIDVEGVTLDQQLRDIPQIDVLKIDIEGGEYHAFLGMMELIKQKKIKRIVFEWNVVMLGEDKDLFFRLLQEIQEKHGGSFHILDQEGRPVQVALEAITYYEFYPYGLIEF
ncbi:FkbM family methyltransferase [Bacillus sp. 123MFChir2]|uniref:FkbM family methyltransferase n=1 Tax=Bacillus sp. 123MFChir2 TaxID=1169144 RepID=UPI000371F1AB|nr:FkbM family methyltransferase [Bacillus sp. 123MFChir2]